MSTHKRYLFLCAWIEGSSSAGVDNTKVYDSSDLYDAFLQENEHVFAVLIECRNESTAYTRGYREAFFNNYTANDSASIVVEVDKSFIPKQNTKVITYRK